jgi:hypothetical protein
MNDRETELKEILRRLREHCLAEQRRAEGAYEVMAEPLLNELAALRSSKETTATLRRCAICRDFILEEELEDHERMCGPEAA